MLLVACTYALQEVHELATEVGVADAARELARVLELHVLGEQAHLGPEMLNQVEV